MDKDNLYLWNVHSDDDEFSYTFINLEQAIESIRNYSDIYINVDPNVEDKNKIINQIIDNVRLKINTNPSDCTITVLISDYNVSLKRITLDKHHVVSKIIRSAYYQVDSNTKKMIDTLYSYS